MNFFAQHLASASSDASCLLHIDVHCDVEVFEWLMSYISKKDKKLEPRTVISILISSHFLKMETLETQCLSFIHQHIQQVLQIPIDMRCIQKQLLQKMSLKLVLKNCQS